MYLSQASQPQFRVSSQVDTIPRIVARGLILSRIDQLGARVGPLSRQRIECILRQLSQPMVDDRFISGQGVLSFINTPYATAPPFDSARRWLLPPEAERWGYTTPDETIWRALVNIETSMNQGLAKINELMARNTGATATRVQYLRDWAAGQTGNDFSIYRCYPRPR
jgi:hypothetical protein